MLSIVRDTTASPVPGQSPGPAGAGGLALSATSDLGALEGEWRAFEAEAVGHVFQTYDFVATWLAHIGAARGVEPHLVTGRNRDGRLRFLLPLAISTSAGARVLHWIGGEQADYHNGLFARDFLSRLDAGGAAALVGAVVAHFAGKADLVHLQRQPELIDGLANPFAAYRSTPFTARSHLTRLGSDWNAYYRSKSNSAMRRRDRLKREKMEAEGAVETFDATTPGEVDAVLAALYAQKRAALAAIGVSDPFADESVRSFLRAMALRPYPRGACHVSAIRHRGEIVATNWGLAFRGRYYYVMTSYDAGPVSVYSPGRALMYHLMQWAIGHGLDTFDFTIGDESYKAHWCEESVGMRESVAALTMRGMPLATTLRVWKTTKRAIKDNPRLHGAVGQIRRRLRARV